MQAYFYDNKSRKNIIHKDITQVGLAKEVLLKDDTNLLNPTIILKTDSNTLKFNYVYLEDLRRYYYVYDITFSQGRVYISLAVDVLMSWANEIMQCDAIVERQTHEYNIYQHDDQMPQLVYDSVYTFKGGLEPLSTDSNNTTFILVTTGG